MQSTGKSALHFAAEQGNTDAIRLLLEHGADIDSTTKVCVRVCIQGWVIVCVCEC